MAGIYGLSGSGMDVDALVKSLMTAQRASNAGLTQKKTVLEWQKEAKNKVYDDINNFRNSIFNYKLQATLNPKVVTSSNTSVVTATALADAGNVSHSLVVSQLADGVKMTSGSAISTTTPPTLGTIASQLGTGDTAFDLTITNGTTTKTIHVDPSSNTMNDLVSKINSSGTNIQANYDSTLDRFFLSTTNTGAATQISLAGDSNASTFIDQLGLGMKGTTDSSTTTYSSVNGKDAKITLDGQALTQSSNVFTISSVAYHLTGTTPYATIQDPAYPHDPTKTIPGQQATSIGITNDVDKAVASIKSLVDSYNAILTEVNDKLDETRYPDYTPLTDDQKTAMKDADVTAWDLKAKSGLLRNDSTLNSLVNVMRNAFSSPISGVTGQYNTSSAIGITTGDYTEKGKLYLDETKLRTALTNDPNALSKVFGTAGTNTVGTTTINPNTQGIAGRLYDALKVTMDSLTKQAGKTGTGTNDITSDIGKQMSDYTTRLTAAKTREDAMQAAYYTKFNAMESALSKLSTQSTWLSKQLG